jgi:hypothetical protein
MTFSPSLYTFKDAPLSSIYCPIYAIAIYLTTVAILMKVMETRKRANNNKPDPLLTSPSVVVVHNLFLSVASLVMFVGCIWELYRRYHAENTIFWVFCEEEGYNGAGSLYFWSYIYYISKYYELLDTILNLLKGSRMPNFKLQVYHHVVVIFMAWAWCDIAQSLQFIGLLFNTFVHVIMYIYYASSAGKWLEYLELEHWKKTIKRTITSIQILQFSTSFVCLVIAIYINFTRGSTNQCSGFGKNSYYSLWGNSIFNFTLLYSFIKVKAANEKKD